MVVGKEVKMGVMRHAQDNCLSAKRSIVQHEVLYFPFNFNFNFPFNFNYNFNN